MRYRNLKRINKFRRRVSATSLFFRRFVDSPRQIGSIVPSSPFLVRKMLDRVDWDKVRHVAELGAGTAVFTRSIVSRADPTSSILVFELDPHLRRFIPKATNLKIYTDARDLRKVLKENGIKKLDCIISSLPFKILLPKVRDEILNAVKESLRSDGIFITYQYSSSMKPHFRKHFLSVKSSFVFLNIPPALVYECCKPTSSNSKKSTRNLPKS